MTISIRRQRIRYEIFEENVKSQKLNISQGSASLAIEIAIANFCKGRILVIETGYYSKRILNIIKNKLI